MTGFLNKNDNADSHKTSCTAKAFNIELDKRNMQKVLLKYV